MIRMTQFRSGREVKDYYTAALKGGDYYTAAEQEGRWQGQLAERLGLEPQVTRESFAALAENRHPTTGEKLTPRTDSDRTVGYDLNFHVPKGVSLLHMMSGDDRILNAIRESVRETMRELEQQTRTRVRLDGQKEGERPTGELVWAEFLHTTTRPLKSGIPDVHLHAHCFTFNATFDPVEQRYKAAQFRDINRDMPYHQQAFYSRLAWRLEDLGYRTERSGKSWDVAGIPESLKRNFSRRTQEIEELAGRLGITAAARKAALGALSRAKKEVRFKPDELREQWQARITPDERQAVESVIASRYVPKRSEKGERSAAMTALEGAIGHCFERASVVQEPRLWEAALRSGIGAFRPDALRAAASRHRDLLRRREQTRTFVTTRAILAEEERMLGFARDGRGTLKPLEGDRFWLPSVGSLNNQQERAIRQLLTSADRVQLLSGGAGTGKTALLREFAKAVETRGHTIAVLAPTAEASRGVLRKAGFDNAETVASFLENPERQRAARGGVLFVDEAGLVGTPTMNQLFEAAQRTGSRIILCGDSRQHAPVERGDALRLLQTRIGLKQAELSEIVRQSGNYKQAVESLHRGDFEKGLSTLDRIGAIREVKGQDWTPLVREYVDTIKTGRSALVVCPTHREGDGITDLIRASLRHEGKLDGEDRLVPQLRDLRLTVTERGDAARYEEGQVVQFHKSARHGRESFRPGSRWVVQGQNERGEVLVRGEKGESTILPLKKAKSFQVFEERPLRLAAGDMIRATGNGRSADGKHRINNGAVFRIKGFSPNGNIRLANGWEVKPDFARLTHGYVGTSHASQGRTVDWVFIAQGAASAGAASAEQLYVSVSRGREGLRLYTDDRATLMDAASRLSTRQSAVELMAGVSPAERSRERAQHLAVLRTHEKEQAQPRQESQERERSPQERRYER